MKIAFIHDHLNQMGGAENVLEQLCEVFPGAPVFTSIVDRSRLRSSFKNIDIKHSFMQRLPFLSKHYKKYLPFYPIAFNRMKLSGYDIIFSISSNFAKGVTYEPGSMHINYCLTPMRFVWMLKQYIEKEEIPFYYLPLLYPLLTRFKRWDLKKNNSIHRFVTLSKTVQERIRNWYGRNSDIIYPPVDTDKFTIDDKQSADYFLVVSRLRGYKRIDLAVKACTELNLLLKIIGDGSQRKMLENMSGPTVEFLGYQNDQKVIEYMQRCKAFIFPGEEDFGIAPLEAQACGRPVIAYKAGGALDTIIDGKTGIFFNQQNIEALSKALSLFDTCKFSRESCRSNAIKFSNEQFKSSITRYIENSLKEFKNAHITQQAC